MGRRRRDRSAAWFRRPECASADGAQGAAVLRTRLRFSWTAWRHREAVVVRWRWALSVCQASGARPIHLATSDRRHRLSESCAVVDALGRHRLAPSAEDLGAADRSVSYTRDSPVFMRLLLMHSDRSYGILRSWFLLPCPTLMGSILKR